jgi:hypothetical protein
MSVEILMEYWPFLVPLIAAQLGLAVAALVHVFKHPTYRFDTKGMWVPVVLFISFIGPLLYFLFGRGDDE